MRKYLTSIILIASLSLGVSASAQETFPHNGPRDQRPESVIFTHVNLIPSSGQHLVDMSVWVEAGKIKAIAKEIPANKGIKVVDLNGKYMYPAFIDAFSSYGLKWESKRESKSQQFLSNKPGAYSWNEAIRAELKAEDYFASDNRQAELFRKAGFGVTNSLIQDGICRGTSVVVSTGNHPSHEAIIKKNVHSAWSFNKGSSSQDYPGSAMGAVALIRQSILDAQWYTKQTKQTNLSLEALSNQLKLPVLMEVENKFALLRADRIAKEFGLNNWIYKGRGDEYQRLKEIKSTGKPLVIPLNFPKPYEVQDPFDAQYVSLADLKHWEMAPFNAALLAKEKIPFALTMKGCDQVGEFWKNLRTAIKCGLEPEIALKALTETPAQLLGISNQAGSIKVGMPAHFIISTTDLFRDNGKILELWTFGKQEVLDEENPLEGISQFTLSGLDSFTTIQLGSNERQEAKLIGRDTIPMTLKQANGSLILQWKKNGLNQITLNKYSSTWRGLGMLANGKQVSLELGEAKRNSEKPKATNPQEKNIEIPITLFPFCEYGSAQLPAKENLLIKNARVWTNEQEGILEEADVWIKDGKIAGIGKNLQAKDARTIDAKGKQLTNGIIDEHSHVAIYNGVNECTQAITAEVRIGDVLNPEDINIYRQLAGGVTAAQLLHGSCNPVGGQSALVKLRWGVAPEEMKIEGADGFIKFALGENVKQSNWGIYSSRYPQTRMGVEQVYYDAFYRAREYDAELKRNPSLRKDLELEALNEILTRKRFISCHSYVQSEINMLMHVADSFRFKVNTFTHILEGYKVADKMKKHGVSASTFADWWAYKYEVVEAIPYNGALLHQIGITTAINSDDAEMGRRLNHEAAKMVKYGNLKEEEAWKMVTLNPAKMLHLDKQTGSIKVGKDADLVLWNDNPLSIYAKPEMTMVDGVIYYSLERDAELRAFVQKERQRIIQRMLEAKQSGEKTEVHISRQDEVYHCEDEN